MNIFSFGEIIWDVLEDDAHLGGAPLNFAAHCAALEGEAYLVSAVGDDDFGEKAVSGAEKFGIHTDYITKVQNKQTGKCIVTLNKKGIPSYDILDDVAYDYIKVPDIKEKNDVIAFGTLSLRGKHNKEVLLKILKEKSFSEIFADINIRKPFCSKDSISICLENATILKISDEELPVVNEMFFCAELSLEQTAKKLAETYKNLKIIIITKGEDGSCCYLCEEDKFISENAVKTEVVSTVGAGDSFGAAFLIKYLNKSSYKECLKFASKISGYVCSNSDSVPGNMEEIIKSLS